MKCENLNWKNDFPKFINYLYSLENKTYGDFAHKITPGDFEIIGINIPTLRKIAKDICKSNYKDFINVSKSGIFEIKMLRALVISSINDPLEFRQYFDIFLPEIDNWAICDTFINTSKVIKKDKSYFFRKSRDLICENSEYSNRVGFVIILNYFVEDDYIDSILTLIDNFKSEYYYANMALSWLLAECYIKERDRTKEFLLNANLSPEVKKMTTRKIKDSFRVDESDKNWLKKAINFS